MTAYLTALEIELDDNEMNEEYDETRGYYEGLDYSIYEWANGTYTYEIDDLPDYYALSPFKTYEDARKAVRNAIDSALQDEETYDEEETDENDEA